MSQFTQDHQEWVDRENERQRKQDEADFFKDFYGQESKPLGVHPVKAQDAVRGERNRVLRNVRASRLSLVRSQGQAEVYNG